MKKKLLAMIIVIGTVLSVTGCNRQMLDVTYRYTYAYIELPGGSIVEGHVDSWKDYEDGDQLQVKIDGITYLTDTTRCVLIGD